MTGKNIPQTNTRQAALRVAAIALLVTAALLLFLYASGEVQADDRAVSTVTSASSNPGELVIT